MVRAIFIFLFSLMVFSYNGYADSVMSSDENSSDVEKQESVSQQEESFLNKYASENTEAFSVEDRPDGHAPIGIIGDHVHKESEFMVSFQTIIMRMGHELKEVQSSRSNEVINVNENVNVDMWMGMLGLMYGLTDRWTIMTMVPYSLYNVSGGEVDHGFGDISLSVLYAPLKEDSYRVILSLEAFFPTGFSTISGLMERKGRDIHYTFYGSAIGGFKSAYAFLLKLSTLFYWDKISLGSQMGFKYSFDKSDEWGFWDALELLVDVWSAYNLSENFSVSLRGAYRGDYISVFSGYFLSSLQDSKNSISSYLGVNFIGTRFLKGHRLAFEFGLPVYQNLIIGMKRSFVVQLGWQKAF